MAKFLHRVQANCPSFTIKARVWQTGWLKKVNHNNSPGIHPQQWAERVWFGRAEREDNVSMAQQNPDL